MNQWPLRSKQRPPDAPPPSVHGHVIADVTGLQAALDGKQAAGADGADLALPDGGTEGQLLARNGVDSAEWVDAPSGRSRIDISGRWYMYTDRRWVTFNATYGIGTENFQATGGTGVLPAVYWNHMGPFIPAGTIIHRVRGMIRAQTNLQPASIDVVVRFQTSEQLAGGNFDTNGEAVTSNICDYSDQAFTDTNWALRNWAAHATEDPAGTPAPFTAPLDGTLLVYIRPNVGSTLTATRYLLSNLTVEVEYPE